jgi:hypothetical protein
LIELQEGCKTGKSDMDVRDSKMMGDSGWLCHCHGMLECAAVWNCGVLCTKGVKVGQECIESVQRLQGPQLFLVEMAMATVGSTSLIGGNVGSCGVDQLPKEMHDMKIRDEKVDHSDDKVY